jgi:non-ribosomal peptide synthetase component E (peptide arylation enzyme)
MGLEMPFFLGTATVLMVNWNAAQAAQLIDQNGVVGTMAATPFLRELVNTARASNLDLRTLRFFACGGASVPPALIREANETFFQSCAFRVFGSSEAPLVTLGYLGADSRELAATTDGQVIDYKVRVVDEKGIEVPAGTDGELFVRGPAMFLGYREESETLDALTGDGYFKTGDLGHLTSDQAIVITGRKKDLIIRGGENISAREIEDILEKHPAVAEAAVVAMPHSRLGEGICAFIVRQPGAVIDHAELTAYVFDSGLAKQKCPERVEVVDELPRTASGKVRKDLLRAHIRSKLEIETLAT